MTYAQHTKVPVDRTIERTLARYDAYDASLHYGRIDFKDTNFPYVGNGPMRHMRHAGRQPWGVRSGLRPHGKQRHSVKT
jgi:hypothetical protein